MLPQWEPGKTSTEPRTTYGRLRQRYEARALAARERSAEAEARYRRDGDPKTLDELARLTRHIDDEYERAAFVRNLDPELIRLRRRRWAA
jgi:hypothetical protein